MSELGFLLPNCNLIKMKTGCLAFNYNKATQQCDFIKKLGATETLNPIYMTGPQMCGVMTGFVIQYLNNDDAICVAIHGIHYFFMIEYF